MFGLDIGKMLSGNGDEKGGGGMIMNMIMKQLASPGTQKMIAGKIDEMFAHLAGSVNCSKEDLSLLLKLENVPATNEKGEFLLEQNSSGQAVQVINQKAIIYVMVGGKAVQKIAIDQFLAMMQEQG
jgi:hypothetical protein